jgi:hypothetical protein
MPGVMVIFINGYRSVQRPILTGMATLGIASNAVRGLHRIFYSSHPFLLAKDRP